jgi:adenosylcobyric acid synthase
MVELEKSRFADEIRELGKEIPVVGICGSYQMLGQKIFDENNKEGILLKST